MTTTTRTAEPNDPPSVCVAIIQFAGGPETVRDAFKEDPFHGVELLEVGANRWKTAAAHDEADRGYDDDPQLLDSIAKMAVKATVGLYAEGRL